MYIVERNDYDCLLASKPEIYTHKHICYKLVVLGCRPNTTKKNSDALGTFFSAFFHKR